MDDNYKRGFYYLGISKIFGSISLFIATVLTVVVKLNCSPKLISYAKGITYP